MGGTRAVTYWKAFTYALFKTYQILQTKGIKVLNLATVDVLGCDYIKARREHITRKPLGEIVF